MAELGEEIDSKTLIDDVKYRPDFILVVDNGTATDENIMKVLGFLGELTSIGVRHSSEEFSGNPDLGFIKLHGPETVLRKQAEKHNIELACFTLPEFKPPNEKPDCKWMRNELNDRQPNGEVDKRAPEIVNVNAPKGITSAERILVLYTIMNHTRFGKKETDVGLESLLKCGAVMDSFALHDGNHHWPEKGDVNERQLLNKYWSRMSCMFQAQPLDVINHYFGTSTGFYFAWLGFYNKMLLPLAVLGVVFFTIGLIAFRGINERVAVLIPLILANMAFAYVHFIKDKVRKVVPTEDIREFQGFIEAEKKYKVIYRNHDGDEGGLYKAYLICLGDTKEEAEAQGGKKRFRLPRLEYPGESTQDESEGHGEEIEKGKSCILKKPRTLKIDKSGLANYKKIVEDSQVPFRSEKTETEKLRLEIDYLKSENGRIQSEKIALQSKFDSLTALNMDLQRSVIDKFDEHFAHIILGTNSDTTSELDEAAGAAVAVDPSSEELNCGFRKGHRVHVGKGIWLPPTIFDSIWRRTKHTLFVKELAVAIFGIETLLTSTVFGNKSKKKPALDSTKLIAMQVAYKKWLMDKGETEGELGKKLKSFDKVLNEKIQDLKRQPRAKFSKTKATQESGIDVENDHADLLKEMEKAKTALDGVVFLRKWLRKECILQLRWNVKDLEVDSASRFGFLRRAKKMIKSPITGQEIPHITTVEEVSMHFLSLFIMGIMLVANAFMIIVLLLWSHNLVTVIGKHNTNPFIEKHASVIASVAASFTTVIFVVIYEKIYRIVALELTNIENPRSQIDFENSYVVKIYILAFVNNYTGLFYIAFVKGRFYTNPGDQQMYERYLGIGTDICDQFGCMWDLGIMIMITLIFKKTALMHLIHGMQTTVLDKVLARKKATGTTGMFRKFNYDKTKQWEREFMLNQDSNLEVLDEYLDMVIQYGYVTFFAACFPLAPLVAFINNIIELRLDARKKTVEKRRIVPIKIMGIGAWHFILQTATIISFISNAMIIAFTSDLFKRVVYMRELGSLTGYLDFSLSVFDTRNFVDLEFKNHNVTTCYFPGHKFDPYHNRQYLSTKFFPYLYTVDVMFVVIFVHAMFLISAFIMHFTPTVPFSVKQLINMQEDYLADLKRTQQRKQEPARRKSL